MYLLTTDLHAKFPAVFLQLPLRVEGNEFAGYLQDGKKVGGRILKESKRSLMETHEMQNWLYLKPQRYISLKNQIILRHRCQHG